MSRFASSTVSLGAARLPMPLALAVAMVTLSAATAARGASRATGAHTAVIGGAQAPPGSYPSIVRVIAHRGKVIELCTGTVVSPELVLTAAHCVENVRTGARYGAASLRVLTVATEQIGQPGQGAGVSAAIVYEHFHRTVADGDAALLVLSAPTALPAVQLPASSTAPNALTGAASFAGWGDIRYAQAHPSLQLRWAATVVQGSRWCTRNAPPFYSRDELCAVNPPRYATGMCNGDSGGPLLAAAGVAGEVTQIGIASHVYSRCTTRLPTVFTSVLAIAPWIRSWIAAYAPPPA
jgi:secreted trypsin-like serine protease